MTPRTLSAALAVGISVLAILGGVTPANAAPAAPMLCQTTIDPACMAPENLAILTEAGILDISGAATAGTTAATATAATGGVGALTASSTATGLGIPGFLTGWQSVWMTGAAGLSGVIGTIALTDAGFFPSPSAGFPKVCGGTTQPDICVQLVGYAPYSGQKYGCLRATLLSTGGNTANNQAVTRAIQLSTDASFPATAGSGTAYTSTLSPATNACRSAFGITGESWMAQSTGTVAADNTIVAYQVGGVAAPAGGIRATEQPGGPQPVSGQVKIEGTCRTGPDASYPTEETATVTIQPGDPIPIPDLTCPDGGLLDGVTISWMPAGGSEWLELNLPTEVPDSLVSLLDLYPECFMPGTPCRLQLEKATGESCGSRGQYCPEWVTQETVTPGTFRCTYGGNVVDIAYCSAFRAPKVGLVPNVTEEGELVPITAPVPPAPAPKDATGEPTTVTAEDTEFGDCWVDSWGLFNPASWVLAPIKCAFEWAFIPRPSVLTATQTAIVENWESSAPAQLADVFISAPWPDLGTSCEGVTIDLTWLGRDAFADADFPENFTILNACPGDVLHPWAVGSTLFLSVGIVVVVFKTWPKLLGALVNYTGADGS